MNKHAFSLYLILLFGLFSFSEGKPCPEKSRPHKTRCDVFYKCTELSADRHVWVPTQCDEGLVYEHSLTVCVLPADDWECSFDDQKQTNASLNENSKYHEEATNSNGEADIYIVTNAEDEDISLTGKYEDGKVEIVIGPDISEEDKDEESVYEGSANGGESVELDGFMPAQNREEEFGAIPVLRTKIEEQKLVDTETNTNTNLKTKEQKIEQKEELAEMLKTIKTKAEVGQPSTNIDPKLTAHLQRLSQLINGLKQTYQQPDTKPQDEQDLRPDQLNAFLAHFNIKNKFDTLDPKDSFAQGAIAENKANKTLYYKQQLSTKLNPETKVVLTHTFPQRYSDTSYENTAPAGYSNSQIVVNRPEGTVHFRLPERNYLEHTDYPADNTPKISEETLKTVLELSKQMIAQQNMPKVIQSPTYFAAPPIMQPILLTPHLDSPFSSNYVRPGSSGHYGHQAYYGNHNNNNNNKTPAKRNQYYGGNNAYDENDNDIYEANKGSDFGDNKPGTTIIHNNVMPLHVSHTNPGEKDMLDSYGQNLSVYPPLHAESSASDLDYHADANAITGYSPGYQNNEYSVSTTKKPYASAATNSSPYAITPRPFEYKPSTSTITQFFTPSQHLDNHNVNNVFPSVDNYGSTPPHMQGGKMPEQLFPQISSNHVEVRPNSQNYGSLESNNEDLANIYSNSDDETQQLITYTFGNKKKPPNYGEAGAQSSINTPFGSNNHYIAMPYSNSLGASSYYTSGKNNYAANSSPLASAYGEGTQLVNVGGNFISLDVFRNSILPLLGNNPSAVSNSLNNVEVITCAAGVRQPNVTDCTRYYVCSRKDGRVLSYSCPPYTAFNHEARICDAKTYALCSNEPLVPTYSISENKRIQMEALNAIQDAKRRQQQQQALKAQILQQYSSSTSSSFNNPFSSNRPDNAELDMLSTYVQQAAAMAQTAATTPRPQLTAPTVKKRKYYCKEGDKIADQTSIYNYFVCYKNAKGQMKGHKLTCSKGLLFCPKSTMCTLPSKCS